MKIALCFAGQTRSFRQGDEYYLKNLLSHHNVDVYIHTWAMELHEQEALIDLYKPKAFLTQAVPVIDGIDTYTNTPNAHRFPARNTWLQFYSIYQCSKLLVEEYDWVIRSRTDFALNFQILFDQLDNNKLYIPDDHQTPGKDFGNDQFAFSSQNNMIKYMATFSKIDEYYSHGNMFIGEHLLSANLRHHGLVGDKLVYVHMHHPFYGGPHNGGAHSLIRDDIDRWLEA